MRYFLLAGFYVLLLTFFATTTAPSQVKHAGTPKRKASAPVRNREEKDPLYIPNIAAAKIGQASTRLPEPFNDYIILKRLFPGGKWLKSNEYYKAGILWRSRDIEGETLVNPVTEDADYFPATHGNLTMVSSKLRYTDDDGQKWLLVVLQSNDGRMAIVDEIICRPQGADMSLALFRRDDSGWVLTNCTIAPGYYGGTWGLLSGVALTKYGRNNYGITVHTSYRGAGGPDIGAISCYGLLNGQYKELLIISQAHFWDAPRSMWYTTIKCGDTDTGFNALKAVTKGWFNTYGLYNRVYAKNGEPVLPEAFEPRAHPREDSFRYHIITEYAFKGGRYRAKNKRVLVRTKNLPAFEGDY